MSKGIKRVFILVLCFVCAISLFGCKAKPIDNISKQYFGVPVMSLTYGDEESFDRYTLEQNKLLEKLNSDYGDVANSYIHRYNQLKQGESLEVPEYVFSFINYVFEIATKTNSSFNPLAYYLVDLWGFSPRFSSIDYKAIYPYDREYVFVDNTRYLPEPKEEYIEGFCRLADINNVEFLEKNGKYYLGKKAGCDIEIGGVVYSPKIDLGGVIKGFAVSELVPIFRDSKLDKGYINYGASSLALFAYSDSGDYTLSLTNPRKSGETNIYLSIGVKNKIISTSGDYEKYYQIGDKRYSHIIDTNSGYPTDNGVVAVTLLGNVDVKNMGAYLDMMTTSIMVMGVDKGIEQLKTLYKEGITGVLTYISGEKRTIFSTENDWKLLDDSYIIEKV